MESKGNIKCGKIRSNFWKSILIFLLLFGLLTLPSCDGDGNAAAPTIMPSAGIAMAENSDTPLAGVVELSTAEAKPADGASEGWWNRVQRGLAQGEYYASENRHGLQAPNRAHNLRTYFEPTGIRVHDRTAAGSPKLVGLPLVGIGRDAVLAPVAAGTVTHAGARVEIRRSGVIEWYENSARGLEQGFTLEQQPQGNGPLVLELAVERARAALHNQSVVLTTEAGRKLSYSGLIARDATGRILGDRDRSSVVDAEDQGQGVQPRIG